MLCPKVGAITLNPIDMPRAVAALDRLNQIIKEYADAADGPITVTLSAVAVEEGGGMAFIVMHDTGKANPCSNDS